MKLGILYPSHVNELVEKRTVLNHFNYIRTSVKLSNVMPYGDFSVGQNKLSAYIGKSPEVFSKYSYQNSDIPSFNKHNVNVLYLYNHQFKYYFPKCIYVIITDTVFIIIIFSMFSTCCYVINRLSVFMVFEFSNNYT